MRTTIIVIDLLFAAHTNGMEKKCEGKTTPQQTRMPKA
jgi:hypothetical protein